jgi:hypothetical protein
VSTNVPSMSRIAAVLIRWTPPQSKWGRSPWRRQGRPRQHRRGGRAREFPLGTHRHSDYASAEHHAAPHAHHGHDEADDHHHDDADHDFNERGRDPVGA